MAQSEVDIKFDTDEKENKKDSRAHSVADYLQAPRRKRRSFVVTALGFKTQEYQAGIELFIKNQFKNLSILHVKNAEDFAKVFRRQIVLLIVDDEFMKIEWVCKVVSNLKIKNINNPPSVLFLTKNAEELIDSYRKFLPSFHEGDDYLNYTKFGIANINSRIRSGLLNQYRRKSRRYHVEMKVNYVLVSEERQCNGRLLDMSVHGALIEAEDGHVFRTGEQLRLRLPIAPGLMEDRGEYIYIAAKVRRVMISGIQSGVSFEYLSETQSLAVMSFVTELARKQLVRRSTNPKLQAAKK